MRLKAAWPLQPSKEQQERTDEEIQRVVLEAMQLPRQAPNANGRSSSDVLTTQVRHCLSRAPPLASAAREVLPGRLCSSTWVSAVPSMAGRSGRPTTARSCKLGSSMPLGL